METQINTLDKAAQNLVNNLKLEEYVETKGDVKYIKLSLDGRKGTFEIGYELSRKLGIRWENGVASVPLNIFKNFLLDEARKYVSQKPDYRFSEYIKGDIQPKEWKRTFTIGGETFLGNNGINLSGLASIGLSRSHRTENQSFSVGVIYNKKPMLSANMGYNAWSIGITGGMPQISTNITGFSISYIPTLGVVTPFSNPVISLIMSSIQKGFYYASKAKNVLDWGVNFIGWSTGILPSVEAAKENFEQHHNIFGAIGYFIKTFVEFWMEIVKQLVVSFVEALDYLISLIREPPKEEVSSEEKAVAIVERLVYSRARKNTEEVEDYVKAYKGKGPMWFRAHIYFLEDVALQDNYGWFKSPLAPWRWFQDKTHIIKKKEQLAIQFVKDVIREFTKDESQSLEKKYNKIKNNISEKYREYIKEWGSFEHALVGSILYLRLKLDNPQYLYTDADVVKQLLYDPTVGVINSVKDIENIVIYAALSEANPQSRAHLLWNLSRIGIKPSDPHLKLNEYDSFMLMQLEKNHTFSDLSFFKKYFSIHTSLPQLLYFFEINPKQAWQVWQYVKKHSVSYNSELFNLTSILGMDMPQHWDVDQFKEKLDPLYKAYKNGKPAAFIKALYNLSFDYLLMGYLIWEDWPEVLKYARKFYNEQGKLIKPTAYGIIVEYLKYDESSFGKKLKEHLKAQIE